MNKIYCGILASVLALCAAAQVYALNPDQVAVIANGRSPDSLKVARHYMQVRGIADDHLITVAVDASEKISESRYQSQIVDVVRKALIERKLDRRVTCLATTYDLPLKIDRQLPTPQENLEINALRKSMVEGLQTLQKLTQDLDAIVPALAQKNDEPKDSAATSPAASAPKPEVPTLPKCVEALNRAMQSAGQRVNALADPAARNTQMIQFMNLQQDAGGLTASSATLRALLSQQQIQLQKEPQNDSLKVMVVNLKNTLDQFQSQIKNNDARMRELAAQQPTRASRREMQSLSKTSGGMISMLHRVDDDLKQLQHENSDANTESELMLLWEDDYSKSMWVMNPYYLPIFARMPEENRDKKRVMMVSRLDGASADAVIRMIDQSLAVEKAGLDGNIYFDARGLKSADAYSHFDNDIRNAAQYMKNNTMMNVVLNDQPALFQAKDCPNAALYCGWYSVHNYQDTVQWAAGCVGYHVASYEMMSLHTPGEKGWVPNMLANGVCGTLGAVEEPYLSSFPPPSLFFPLIASGKFTQAEVYYMTTPMLSWRVGYVGDPLYNPFKIRPQLTGVQLTIHPLLRQARVIFPNAW